MGSLFAGLKTYPSSIPSFVGLLTNRRNAIACILFWHSSALPLADTGFTVFGLKAAIGAALAAELDGV
ncbi:MAG: hypothetical protein ACR2QH_06560 [Geminicoccaceae bacterium]